MADLRWEEPAVSVRDGLSFVIRHVTPDASKNRTWGDYHFSRGLAEALKRLGHRVRLDARADWSDPVPAGAVVLLIRGLARAEPVQGAINLMWLIYPGAALVLNPDELDDYDHIFIASRPLRHYRPLRKRRAKTSVLLQAFDPAVMYPGADQRDGIIFVGNNHRHVRDQRATVRWAVDTQTPLKLWGRFWLDLPPNVAFQGNWLDNADLGAAYRSASIVLCDHTPAMREHGFISNRIFDALACGTPVISDALPDLPEEFAPHVQRVNSADEFRVAVETFLAEPASARAARQEFAMGLRQTHSFDARAATLVAIARSHGAAG